MSYIFYYIRVGIERVKPQPSGRFLPSEKSSSRGCTYMYYYLAAKGVGVNQHAARFLQKAGEWCHGLRRGSYLFSLSQEFFMQEMNVRSFLIKGQEETCQGLGNGGARVGMGGKVPQPLLRRPQTRMPLSKGGHAFGWVLRCLSPLAFPCVWF